MINCSVFEKQDRTIKGYSIYIVDFTLIYYVLFEFGGE